MKMNLNFILIPVLLSVLQTSFSYKLRRDIGKVRYYCNDICKSCGGEGELNLDTCICKFEEDTAESQECLNKNRNKFDFLGIKWKMGHESIKKRSISTSDYPHITERESIPQNLEQTTPYKQLFRRSYNFAESDYPRFKWRIVDNQEKLQDLLSNSRPRLVLVKDSKKNLEPVGKGTNRYHTKSDLTRFAADMFQPVPEQLHRRKEEFKMLIDEPVQYLEPKVYHKILEDSKVYRDDQGSAEDEDFDSDYEDESECGDNILARLENLRSGPYDSTSSQEEPFDFVTNVNDKIDEKSDWETLPPKVYSQNSHNFLVTNPQIRDSVNVK